MNELDIIKRMTQMENASKNHPNLLQTYEKMWKALKKELEQEKNKKTYDENPPYCGAQ